ncbi:PREDICTED: interactor of constitutive active ROPs 4-like [Nelumbo nucifera]|uniref:Interactor of constitutive active ROPs 4-like n=1 Tax=Nelumbo nucifera TaxID=4432 RepID=A0A1U8Q178_NELNU|nr:PREDICTED: interactor of constitutive active ROPs 4-like [Nelumbo nucifera]
MVEVEEMNTEVMLRIMFVGQMVVAETFFDPISDLKSQLGQAQEELKEQLAFAEADKKEAQEELEKKTKEPAAEEATKEVEHLPPPQGETHEPNEEISIGQLGSSLNNFNAKHQKKLRVQTETEQWRKAADAATAVLADRMEMNGRVTERCGSMDKHLNNGGLETAGGGYTGFDNLHYSLLQ